MRILKKSAVIFSLIVAIGLFSTAILLVMDNLLNHLTVTEIGIILAIDTEVKLYGIPYNYIILFGSPFVLIGTLLAAPHWYLLYFWQHRND